MRWMLALIGLVAPLAVPVPGSAEPPDAVRTVVTVQGETPTATNIPTAQDSRASGGAYLALDTVRRVPAGGWYATYEVEVPRAGIYRLDAVLTTPAMPDRQPFGGSQFNLSVNGSPFAQVVKSEPVWASQRTSPRAWGSLVDTTVDDVELRRGSNTFTFMVDERRISASPQLDHPPRRPTAPRYRFFLDELTLTRTPLALEGVHLGDPLTNLGTYRDDRDGLLHVVLNGRADTDQSVRYRIVDYFGACVGAGTVLVLSGSAEAAVPVPEDLPAGNYRVTARLASSPDDPVVGNFAHLPDQRPVSGHDNRFGVTTSAPWLVPSSRLHAFASALHEMGAGYVRDEIAWPLVEPRRGAFHLDGLNRIARVFHQHGLHTLGALWNLAGTGEAQAPRWAMTDASRPLPADLRAAYRLGRRLAAQSDGIGRDAVELWNEPDIDVVRQWYSRTSGDQYAAFVKAAALGIAAGPGHRPLVSLPGIAFPGAFQDVMLQNDLSRYADIWSFHGYAGDTPSEPPTLSTEPRIENQLRRAYRADVQTWMTEAGIFLDPQSPEHGLTRAQQVQQARYLVQSTVDALAAGNDKQFWFSAAPYGGFGLLNNDFQPWPSYSAHAAMASILGEADFAGRLRGLTDGVRGYRFDSGGEAVTVLWAQQPTRVHVDVTGEVRVDNIMGGLERVAPAVDGSVTVMARPDPIYLVADGSFDRPASDLVVSRPELRSEAERIVLSQRFTAAARPKPLPFGYRLQRHARMAITVYNFNDRAQRVTVQPRAFGGWSIRGSGARAVAVPAHGQVRVPYTVSAGDRVLRRVDYPLVFDATVDGQRVPPSVSRIQLGRTGPPGEPIRLSPWIFDVAPADGSTVTGPRVRLTALVWDELSRVAPRTVRVEVDGRRVRAAYNPRTGRLAARLRLSPGRHQVWIGAFNQAYAPSHATATWTVRR